MIPPGQCWMLHRWHLLIIDQEQNWPVLKSPVNNNDQINFIKRKAWCVPLNTQFTLPIMTMPISVVPCCICCNSFKTYNRQIIYGFVSNYLAPGEINCILIKSSLEANKIALLSIIRPLYIEYFLAKRQS